MLSQTEKASLQLFIAPLICSVRPTFYHNDKTKTQLFGSRLRQWNLLERCVAVSFCRKRQSGIATYYSQDGDLVYWNNIQELMEKLRLEHISGQWRQWSDGYIKRRVSLFKAKNFQIKWDQDERWGFLGSTNYTTIRRPKLKYQIEF
jgi:hypothetical protein